MRRVCSDARRRKGCLLRVSAPGSKRTGETRGREDTSAGPNGWGDHGCPPFQSRANRVWEPPNCSNFTSKRSISDTSAFVPANHPRLQPLSAPKPENRPKQRLIRPLWRIRRLRRTLPPIRRYRALKPHTSAEVQPSNQARRAQRCRWTRLLGRPSSSFAPTARRRMRDDKGWSCCRRGAVNFL
jgi:hypothetical protein